MTAELIALAGSRSKPAVVFIHGLGMDKNIWVDPAKSRILGGMFPLTALLWSMDGGEPRPLRTLFHDLSARGYPVVAWSQRRQSAEIDAVIPELVSAAERADEMSDVGIILVGHSRGGLIGRRYLSLGCPAVRGLVTISTPHRGSAVAKVARYVAPLTVLLHPLVAENDKTALFRSIRRISEFLRSKALLELLPESEFFRTLKDEPRDGVFYLSAGGTNPALFTLSRLSFPDVFERIIPEDLYPDELRMGKGDGLVTAASAKLPWGDRHYTFPCNHAMILFDERARSDLARAIDRCTENHGEGAT